MERGRLLEASLVAARSLRANIREVEGRRLVAAGPGQYGSVWARDFAWSLEGLLAAGEERAARDTLELFLAHQRPDGLLPRLLDTRWPWARFARAVLKERLELKPPLVPNFLSDQLVVSHDVNALLVWAACRYAARADQPAWGGLVLPKLEAALAWYRGRESDGLVLQPPCADWKDKVKARRGAVFYTNLARWKALTALAELHEASGRRSAAEAVEAEARALKRRLQKAFWDEAGGFFQDVAGVARLSSDGNLAACAWDFADDEQAAKVVRAMDRLRLWTLWGPKAGERYAAGEKSLLSRLAGIPGYQDDGVWLWQSALALRVFARLRRQALLERLAEPVCALLLAEGAAGEVYDPQSGRPMAGRLYRAESPFTWSAAMLLEALAELTKAPGTSVNA